MTDDFRQVWRQAVDANIRLYREWGRVTERYASDLAAAVRGLAPVIRLPVPSATVAAATPAPPAPVPTPAPGLVLEGPPVTVVQSALLVQNHLDHPVTTAVRAELSDPAAALVVEPETVTLAPGEEAIVRVTATVPEDGGAPALHGVLSCPELVGTTLPVVVRATPATVPPPTG